MSKIGEQREALSRLRDHLTSVKPGRIPKDGRTEVVRLIQAAWPALQGHGSAQSGAPANVEALRWNLPVLRFSKRDRGLYYDEVRRCKIDVETGECAVTPPNQRVERKHIGRIADELAPIIAERRTDDRLQWSKAGKVRVRIKKVLPPAPNRTMHDRRRRLYGALHWRLAPLGWVRLANGWWDPVDMAQIADELAKLISDRQSDERLEWSAEEMVRVRLDKVLPSAPRGIMQERRQRLCGTLNDRLAPLGYRRLARGWWDLVDTARIAEELAKLIADRQSDDRLEWSESGKVRLRDSEVLPPASSSMADERWDRFEFDLSERLARLGWTLDASGWWEYVPWYAGLHVCSSCGGLAGRVRLKGRAEWVEQSCDCSRTASPKWPGFDFNLAVELCRCCGQVPLESGSRYSVWFCKDCKEQVGLLNGRLGRCVVPIGRHSVHAGFLLRGDAGPVDIHIFADSWKHITDVMKHLDEWAAVVVKGILAERWGEPPKSVPITEYLDRSVDDEAEKMRRFREMMEFLQGRAGTGPGHRRAT